MEENFKNKYPSYELPSASNQRLSLLQQQQQQTYKAFQLDNFYQNRKLNLQRLKNQIQKHKKNQKNNRTINKPSSNANNNLMPINSKNTKNKQIHTINQFQSVNCHFHQNLSYANNDNQNSNNRSTDAQYHNPNQKNPYHREQIQPKRKNIQSQYQSNNNKLDFIAVPKIKKQIKQKNRAQLNGYNHHSIIQPKPTTPIVSNQTGTNFRQHKNHNSQYGKIHQRQKYVQSNFQSYQPAINLHHNPQLNTNYNNFPSRNNAEIKRQLQRERTQEERQVVTRNKPKTYHFKIQPITSVGAKSFKGEREKQQRGQRYAHNKKNRSTQKSFYGSQKQSILSNSNLHSQQPNYNKKLSIQSQQQLVRLQKLISQLWNLYQTLTFIMLHANDFPFAHQRYLQRYVNQVCSQKFEYLRTILSIFNYKRLNKIVRLAKLLENISIIYLVIQMTKKKLIKQSHIVNFIGYCTSNIIFIIKILYLLHDVQIEGIRKQNNTLDNTIIDEDMNKGYSQKKKKSYSSLHHKETTPQKGKFFLNKNHKGTQNLIKSKILIDDAATIDRNQIIQSSQNNKKLNHLLQLNHINQPQTPKFTYSQKTKNILSIIRKFQIDSYRQQIHSLLDVIIRMQHNCQIINIVQVKLCSQTQKQVQVVITDFLKDALREEQSFNRRKNQVLLTYENATKTYYDSAHYIFEYLAYYIAKQKLYGIVPLLQVCPRPYLNLKYQHTVIIQPYQVLVYQKSKNILIRAYSQSFIESLSKLCNIIFWSDMMPQQIDPILQLFPKKQNIYYLYKYHCIYDNQINLFVKNLDRVGGRVENTIIIDRNQRNYINYKLNGIQFFWSGQKKDDKLQQLYKLLQPIFTKSHSLRKSLSEIRPQIVALSVKKKKMLNNKPFMRHHKFQRIQDQQSSFQRNGNSHNSYNQFNSREQYRNQKNNNNSIQNSRQYSNKKQYYQHQNQHSNYKQIQDSNEMQQPMQIARQYIYNNQDSHQQSSFSKYH